jgi:hypothetical protein
VLTRKPRKSTSVPEHKHLGSVESIEPFEQSCPICETRLLRIAKQDKGKLRTYFACDCTAEEDFEGVVRLTKYGLVDSIREVWIETVLELMRTHPHSFLHILSLGQSTSTREKMCGLFTGEKSFYCVFDVMVISEGEIFCSQVLPTIFSGVRLSERSVLTSSAPESSQRMFWPRAPQPRDQNHLPQDGVQAATSQTWAQPILYMIHRLARWDRVGSSRRCKRFPGKVGVPRGTEGVLF